MILHTAHCTLLCKGSFGHLQITDWFEPNMAWGTCASFLSYFMMMVMVLVMMMMMHSHRVVYTFPLLLHVYMFSQAVKQPIDQQVTGSPQFVISTCLHLAGS